ncbi:signal peptidase complex catalytic subunit SEC11C [Trichonephila inaurata madagascariensis]|uniref:Signal peptidase complex catalytic subunit SEC11 n=1 Tax=Trichonephila inaurata madagascariensis TaxID=2747483 RepID=A0A8X6MKG9_9ARAC|nr:signal peptidase complex catalytic subunit SEC11C [Trichonephila inaurata madagascariensis]
MGKHLYSLLQFSLIIGSVYSLWYALTIITGCKCPLSVTITNGMEPALRKGDILFATNYEEDTLNVGDIILFDVKSRENSIVHRIIQIRTKPDGTLQMLTKGDNRPQDDTFLFYAPGQMWLEKKDVIGKVKGVVPPVGILIVLFQEYKLVVLGCAIAYLIATFLISRFNEDLHHHLHH